MYFVHLSKLCCCLCMSEQDAVIWSQQSAGNDSGACVGGIVHGTGCGWRLSFPTPSSPGDGKLPFHSSAVRNKPDLSQSSSSRSVAKNCRTSHVEKGRDHRTGTGPQTWWEHSREQEVSQRRAANSLPENLNWLKGESASRKVLN